MAASGASIDQLKIEIEAEASSAKSGVIELKEAVSGLKRAAGGTPERLENLASALNTLSGMTGKASQMASIASSLSVFKGVKVSATIGKNLSSIANAVAKMPGTASVSAMANAVGSIGGVKISSTIANQIARIGEALPALDRSITDGTVQRINSLSDAIAKLASVPKSNLNSTLNSLKKVPEAVKALKDVDLTGFSEQCAKLSSALGSLPQKMSSIARGFGAIKASSSALKSVSDEAKEASKHSGTLTEKLSKLAGIIGSIRVVANALRQVANALGYCIDASNRYIENMNLADVSLGKYAGTAGDYANAVQSALGINSGEFMRNQGTFMTMAQGMGVATDNAYQMSKGLTQLSYDLASFFNISNDEAFEKVKSGLAGEIEPLRALGYDLTNARLQQEAYNLGISKNVSSMTQAEKAMLRYRAIMSQVSWAQNDLARTASSPANQIRILKSQLQTAAQSIGNVFLPMLKAIIPVVVAVVKVISTLANVLAGITGGTKIAAVNFGSGGDVSGGLNDTADAANNAASGLGGAGKAAKGAGDKAGNAAKQVKELKRQLMSFDEINKFSEQSDSGSGSGGSGGGGGGGGGGAGGGSPTNIGDIKLNAYDWDLNSGFGDELYNEIMSFLNRIKKAFDPLVNDFKVLGMAIRHQFEGLDIAGAIKNSIAAAVHLISNAVRNVVEILGPLVVAFNFPETIAYAFNLAAQMCLTLSAAINAVGSMVKGFTDVALIQLVAWIGDKLRGAIKGCIELLQSWQDWFIRNTSALTELGRAAGIGATFVLSLAEAFANGAFAVAAAAIGTINTVLQVLLEFLVNSAPARVAVALLGAALTALAIGNGIASALQTLGTTFENMAKNMKGEAEESDGKIKLLSSDLKGNLSTGLKSARDGFKKLTSELGITKTKTDYAAKATEHAATATADASEALANERTKLNDARRALGDNATFSTKLSAKTAALRVKTAESNLALQQSKDRLNAAKLAAMDYASGQDKSATSAGKLAVAELRAGTEVAANTVKLGASTAMSGAATVAEGALTVAKTAGAVAQGLLNAAISAFPGMILMTALSGILTLLSPLVSGIGDAILGFLGFNNSVDDVTDSTEEANQALEQEKQQINDNLESIQKYEQSHNNLKDAIAMAGFSEEEFARYLQQTGQTFDEVSQKIDSYATSTVNSFKSIDTAASMSADELKTALEHNITVTRQFHDDMKTIMEKTGLDSSSALIQQMLEAGPEGVGTAAHEMASKSKEELAWMVTDSEQVAKDSTDAVISEYYSSVPEAQQAGKSLGEAAASSAATAKPTAEQSGKSLADSMATGVTSQSGVPIRATQSMAESATAQLNAGAVAATAQQAGKSTAESYGSGVTSGSTSASSQAKAAADSAASALSDTSGKGTKAGGELIKNYGKGIKNGASAAKTQAKSAMESVAKMLDGKSKATEYGKKTMDGFASGVNSGISSAVSKAKSASSQVANALKTSSSSATNSGSSIMAGFKSGLSSGVNSAVATARSAATSVANGLRGGTSAARSAGASIGSAFKSGLSSTNASATGSSVANGAVSGMGGKYDAAHGAGRNVGIGFNNGLASTARIIYQTAATIASNVISKLRSAFRIHSPSKATAEIGMYVSLGLANGITDYASKVSDSARSVATEALDATSEAIKIGSKVGSAYGAAVQSNIDIEGVKSALSGTERIAVNADFSGASAYRMAAPEPASHAWTGDRADTERVADVITRAVIQSLVTTNGVGSAQQQGDTVIVLKAGEEELARATMRGQASLARRGVLDLG